MSDRKIRIDVLTLDSVQCAACGYMMESLAALPSDVQEMIEYKEWSIKTKEGIKRFMELKGKVLPTICIEGDLVFPSVIPQYEELIEEMAKRAPQARRWPKSSWHSRMRASNSTKSRRTCRRRVRG